MNIDQLIRTGKELRATIDQLKKQLDNVNEQLASAAVFANGKATTYVQGEELRAKVVNRAYEKWDQEKLHTARAAMGDAAFLSLFKYEWSPRAKKEVQGFIAHGDPRHTKLLKDALTTRMTPVVVYEEAK